MVAHLDRDDVIVLGNEGNLDGMAAHINSETLETLDDEVQEGILTGLDANYLSSKGKDFRTIVDEAQSSAQPAIKFDDQKESQRLSADIETDSPAINALRAGLSSLTSRN